MEKWSWPRLQEKGCLEVPGWASFPRLCRCCSGDRLRTRDVGKTGRTLLLQHQDSQISECTDDVITSKPREERLFHYIP